MKRKEVTAFLKKLRAFSSDDVCNPWRDYHEGIDIGPEAPKIRTRHLKAYLEARIPHAKYLLVAEALGYQGGRFSGIAMTSERMVMGKVREIPPHYILSSEAVGRRTSDPTCVHLRESQKMHGMAEPTATIVWDFIVNRAGLDPREVVFWNIFPFHPYDRNDGRLSNRDPRSDELRVGIGYVKSLQKLLPDAQVISIGQFSKRTLDAHGINHDHIPHPSYGNANQFREEFTKLLRNREDG
ncbi:uracil-DNA glycosylase [Paenibacillus thermotolerans]|uniref:uracil-DNA glycosylase n=1 Tax=Paenibacillus thermotolerans TaxID=3027807 RepID=UPI002368173D|nr:MULTISPECIES: uracil-DNA glycosylase [unclassified Paenibacillus]